MDTTPKIIFGVCFRCSAKGADAPAADLTEADAQDNLDAVGNGVELFLHDGEYICQLCIKDIEADEESRLDAHKQADEEKFRQQAGFTKRVI
jgi:hypothetical protein